jgi:DNA processing protein
MEREERVYRLTLSRIKGIGPAKYKMLLSHFRKAEDIFQANLKYLSQLNGITPALAQAIIQNNDFRNNERELEQYDYLNVRVIECTEPQYPQKLLWCNDHPIFLFMQGQGNLNTSPMLAFVGTRHNSDYGQRMCEELIAALVPYQPCIVSGLAFGIDIIAHKAAIKHELPTLAVLASGLDMLYPRAHLNSVKQMLSSGGILCEYPLGTPPDKNNFPTRNRIVAGMCDATIVIETDVKGGSMITAELAYGYNRDVFCVPGRVFDQRSAGCNLLIKNLKAQMLTHADDLVHAMGWKSNHKLPVQTALFQDWSDDEQQILRVLQSHNGIHLDELALHTALGTGKLSAAILQLEMKNAVKMMPGKLLCLV